MGALENYVAVVTGGGRGLGRAFAVALAHEGARVAVVARSEDQLDETVAQVKRAGGAAHAFVASVTNPDAASSTHAAIRGVLGPIDILINNAGVATPIGPLAEADVAEWWQCLEINLRGPMLWSRLVLPDMIQRKRGRIINVAGGAGAVAIPYMSAYVTSKTALIRFTEVLAQEVARHGVQVFSIEPGTVRTAMAMYALESPAGRRWVPWYRNIFDEKRDVLPEYSAELVVRLARGDADVLTGRFIARG
ncbi:MAG TPA: SDR family oxidoreductase, partial [Longimicrobiales bacterium]|nr:SDR family oxidoreductase [Longimicrobiales bacterium]